MKELTTKNLRYIFYLDILGFKNLINERSPDDIYNVIEKFLEVHYSWEKLNNLFSTIYFSDTIIFYQTREEYINTAFLDIYGIAGIIYSKLLAEGIPVRGAITLGEFYTKYDSKGRNNIFFGEALIEAHELEKKEWIGIIISYSAFKKIDNIMIEAFIKENVFERQSENLLLNPFHQIRSLHSYESIYDADREMLLAELKAIKYLLDKKIEYNLKAPASKEFKKYSNTVNFLERNMKDGKLELVKKLITELI